MSKETEFQSLLTEDELEFGMEVIGACGFIADWEEPAILEEDEYDDHTAGQEGFVGGFDDLILADLVDEGGSDDALQAAVKEQKAHIRAALDAMIADAKAAANGNGECYTMEDVFGEE